MFLNEQLLRQLAAQGLSVGQIAREMNVTQSRVWRSAVVLGIEVIRAAKRGPKPIVASDSESTHAKILALAAEGLHVAEIARRSSYSHRGITLLLQRYGVTPSRGGWIKKGPKDTGRTQKMVGMYQQGLTLVKIGDAFDMTRERVRQILKANGITAKDGGASKCAASKEADKLAKRDARCLAKHGMTFAEYKQVRASGLQVAYRSQQNAANHRGIEWGLTLAQWLDVWRTSGKLDQRGRGKGKYVMSRIKDAGGYVLGNVHIQLATANSLEAVKQWRGKTKTNRGVFCLYPGSERPYVVRVGGKQIGRYSTEQEGADARLSFIESQGYALRDDGSAHRVAA